MTNKEGQMTLEQRVEELEQKLKQLRDYVADKLDKKPTTRRVWTAEEVAFMKERYRQGPTSLCKMWNSKFGHDRTVDSIRNKGVRVGITWPQ
mgnify:FL=1|jgi:hypothetical protein